MDLHGGPKVLQKWNQKLFWACAQKSKAVGTSQPSKSNSNKFLNKGT